MKIFSFDAESNGLWGEAFCIAATVYENGTEVKKFIARCEIDGEVNTWVKDNVLPVLNKLPIPYYGSYLALLEAFTEFYLENKKDAVILGHMVVPVESQIISDLRKYGLIECWDAPYPLMDLAGCLAQAGEDPTSPDAYNAKNNSIINGSAHDPLYDCRAVAECYLDLQLKKQIIHRRVQI